MAVPDARRALRGAAEARSRGGDASRSARSTAGSRRTGASPTATGSSRRRTCRSPISTGRCASSSGRSTAAPASSACGPGAAFTAAGPCSPVRRALRPVLGARRRGGRHGGRARRRQRATRRTATPATASARRSTTTSGPTIKIFHIERAIYDFLATLVFERLFERFPNLRIASVENGSEFLARPVPQAALHRAQVRRLLRARIRSRRSGGTSGSTRSGRTT